MKTIVYVDGYNFYHACCKETPHKWLNPHALAVRLLPGHSVTKLYYFTAKVKPQPHDPRKSTRQDTYWRALETVPEITIVKGKYLSLKKRLPIREPKWLQTFRAWCCKSERARRYMRPFCITVIKEEEKRSDVNLATQLLLDAFDGAFECAVVVSNDTDLLTPIEIVRGRFKKKVGLIGGAKPNSTMTSATDFYKEARAVFLTEAQFPPRLSDAKGEFHKPEEW